MSKYKIGDKVKIKLKPDYGDIAKKIINSIPDRVVTVISVSSTGVYDFKDTGIHCNDNGIECLVEEYIPIVPIYSRFEILDL